MHPLRQLKCGILSRISQLASAPQVDLWREKTLNKVNNLGKFKLNLTQCFYIINGNHEKETRITHIKSHRLKKQRASLR